MEPQGREGAKTSQLKHKGHEDIALGTANSAKGDAKGVKTSQLIDLAIHPSGRSNHVVAMSDLARATKSIELEGPRRQLT